MKKGIHPLLHRLRVVTSQGASTRVWSTMKARNDTLFLQSDPSNHPAWTGKAQVVVKAGRYAKFLQRFGGEEKDEAPPAKEQPPAKE